MPGARQEQTVRIATHYLIYIPHGDAAQALADCLSYAEIEHPEWIPAGVVVGQWQAIVALLADNHADVVLIAARAHLPADRIPRVVAVEEELSGPPPRDSRRPTGRRPRLG